MIALTYRQQVLCSEQCGCLVGQARASVNHAGSHMHDERPWAARNKCMGEQGVGLC